MTRATSMRLPMLLACTALLLGAGTAASNDSFMGLPAGGLTLQKSADIAMLEEDLYVSTSEIRVDYRFRNEGRAPITALVGFPMPGLPVAINFDVETGYDMPEVRNLDLLAFETRIDGRVVKSSPVVRAYVFPPGTDWGREDLLRFTNATDVTAELQAAGMPLSFDAAAIRAVWTRMPAARRNDWARRGLYAMLGEGQGHPAWFLSTVFVREQAFYPGQVVRVQHRYRPKPGGFIMATDHFRHDPGLARDACVDQPTRRAISKLQAGGLGAIGYEVDYILTSANTWKGPIGRFRLTVDKGKPANIVSFCGDGVRKTGPTTFSLERRNFRPDRELKVLVVQTQG
jgi:hypothetical protein